MATQLQMRRGTASQNSSFTGAEGEVSVNTTNDSLHIHDGSTAGGFELARADLNNVSDTDLNAALTGNTVSALTVTALTTAGVTTTGNISFDDNGKAIFGAGSDLQIYHDGSNSYIQDNGTGALILEGTTSTQIKGSSFVILRSTDGENMAVGNANGSFDLYHNNVKKLATTSTGIDVTGTVVADNAEIGTGGASNANAIVDLTGDTTYTDFGFRIIRNSGANGNTDLRHRGTGNLNIEAVEAGNIVFETSDTEKMRIDASGNVGIGTSSPDEQMHLHGGSSATRLRISGGALDETYGGFIEGEGVSGQGGHLRLGVVDNGTDRVAIEIEEQGNQIVFDTAGTERMRIDSAGNVGIGTNSPNSTAGFTTVTLNNATSGGIIDFENNTSLVGRIYNTSTNFHVYNQTANSLLFGTSATERMRIDSSGRLGIGTSSPSHLLELVRSSTDFGPTLEINNTSSANGSTASVRFVTESESTGFVMGKHASGFGQADLAFINQELNSDLAIFTNNTERMRIDSSGHITSLPTYNNGSASSANMVVNSSGLFLRSVSSAKYKTNIEDVQDAYVDSLLNIRPVYYRSTLENDNTEHSHWGFIAEEVAEIDPRLVHYKTVDISYSDDGERVETELETPEPEGVQYDRFAPLMLKLIQKQQATITALEARITQLENN